MSTTLQAPPTASMLVSAGQAGICPVSSGLYPREGSRCVSAQYAWGGQTAYAEDLSQLEARGIETTFQAVYADNSQVSQFVTLNFPATGQVLVIPPYTQACLPVLAGRRFSISLPFSEASTTRLLLLNVPLQAYGTWQAVAGPSLDLSFMSPGVLDPRVSFTRASGGTYFDRNGVMQNAAVNLLLQSANLAIAPWTLGGAGSAPTVTANQATAPDGTLTAARIALSVTSGTAASFVYQIPPTSTVNPYVFSVYLRGSVGGEQIYLFTTPDAVSYFRQPITLGLAWQRFSLITPSLTATNWFFALGVDLRDGGQAGKPAQTIYAWGAQLELGASPSPYIPTTSTPMGAPRWDYNPATLALNGLLIEEARTNTALSSGNLGAAPWAPAATGATPVVTANNATAPDGTLTAARIVMPAVPAGANAAFVGQATGIPSAQQTSSMWLRGAVGGETVNLAFTNFITYFHTTAVLTTAWQRFSVVGTSVVGGWSFFVGTDMRDPTQTPTVAQTFYAWGAQTEAGAFPTSLIPTTAVAVTRAFDSCFIAPANMAPWFAPPGGTWFAEFVNQVPTAITTTSPRIIGIHDATGITPLWDGSTAQLSTYDGSSAAYSGLVTVGAVSKGASTWSPGLGQVCLNGGTIGTAALTTGFATLATSGVGIMGGNPGVVNETMTGYIRRVRYWPRVLSNAELQSVTT